jgi:Alkylmercury lyase
MDDADRGLRNVTYSLFVELGHAPSAAETGLATGLEPGEVAAGWRRLDAEHAIVLDAGDAIRMANPFSAVPTAYRVRAAGRWWYANCAWDAFGICTALDSDGRIEASCPDCGEPITADVRGGRSDDETLLFHCVVPAARWWDDITFT